MDNTPLVSILMNCFNGERYLREAIDSVISQTYQNWELVFWDNQSTDKSKAIFDSYQDSRLKYYYAPEHTDLGGGRANAFKHLVGDYIAVLDTDDVWLPSKLEKQLQLFSDPDIGIVISDTLFFNETDDRPLYNGEYPAEGDVFRELLTGYFVSLETLMLRKSVVDRLSYGFDADFSFIADFDIVLRVSQISKLAVYKEVLAKWRVHEASDSWRFPASFSEEKERWIDKQIKHNIFFSEKYKDEIAKMHDKNNLMMAFSALLENRRIKALKFLFKSRFPGRHNSALFILCFIPFSNSLLRYFQKQRVKRLLA
ncbi:MAG: glycosyltransferase [Gammaproteobacteria bacterium]|nr:glycosyltransferase [Gammaproteobacteria bacterium]